MVRRHWLAAALAGMTWPGLLWSQSSSAPLPAAPAAPSNLITLNETGRPLQQCQIQASWTDPSGARALQVRALATGETITLVEQNHPATATQPARASLRVYHWGQSTTPPPGAPVPASIALPTGPLTAPLAPAPAPAQGPAAAPGTAPAPSIPSPVAPTARPSAPALVPAPPSAAPAAAPVTPAVYRQIPDPPSVPRLAVAPTQSQGGVIHAGGFFKRGRGVIQVAAPASPAGTSPTPAAPPLTILPQPRDTVGTVATPAINPNPGTGTIALPAINTRSNPPAGQLTSSGSAPGSSTAIHAPTQVPAPSSAPLPAGTPAGDAVSSAPVSSTAGQPACGGEGCCESSCGCGCGSKSRWSRLWARLFGKSCCQESSCPSACATETTAGCGTQCPQQTCGTQGSQQLCCASCKSCSWWARHFGKSCPCPCEGAPGPVAEGTASPVPATGTNGPTSSSIPADPTPVSPQTAPYMPPVSKVPTSTPQVGEWRQSWGNVETWRPGQTPTPPPASKELASNSTPGSPLPAGPAAASSERLTPAPSSQPTQAAAVASSPDQAAAPSAPPATASKPTGHRSLFSRPLFQGRPHSTATPVAALPANGVAPELVNAPSPSSSADPTSVPDPLNAPMVAGSALAAPVTGQGRWPLLDRLHDRRQQSATNAIGLNPTLPPGMGSLDAASSNEPMAGPGQAGSSMQGRRPLRAALAARRQLAGPGPGEFDGVPPGMMRPGAASMVRGIEIDANSPNAFTPTPPRQERDPRAEAEMANAFRQQALASQRPMVSLPPMRLPVPPSQLPQAPYTSQQAMNRQLPLAPDAGVPSGLANAFTTGWTGRPLPADLDNRPQELNAFGGGDNMSTPTPPPAAAQMAGSNAFPSSAGTMMAAAPRSGGYLSPPQGGVAPMPTVRTAAYAPAAAMPASAALPAQSLSPPQLQLMLRDSIYPSHREWAAEQLALLDWRSQQEAVFTLVQAAQNDPAPTVRAACVHAVGTMKANLLPVVQALQALQNDRDLRVRQEVSETLAALGAPAASPARIDTNVQRTGTMPGR